MKVPFVGPAYQARSVLDMGPGFAVEDHPNKTLPDSVFFRQGNLHSAIRRRAADCKNLSFRQLRIAVRHALYHRPHAASLLPHVGQVFGVSPKKQMCRVDATAVITFVAHEKTARASVVQQPTHAMGQPSRSIKSNSSVAHGSAGRPIPAVIWAADINFLPEAFGVGRCRHASPYGVDARRFQVGDW